MRKLGIAIVKKTQKDDTKQGAIAAVGAYGLWGVFPLLFRLLDGVNPVLIVAHRVVWSLLFVGSILKIQGRMGEVSSALRDRRTLVVIFLSALLLAANWLIFIWAVENGRVLDVSLGYFINPLVNVALGMIFLGERQNFLQWVAIFVAIIAMVIQTIGLGSLPIVPLSLAITFGLYGFLRKTVNIGSAPGLFIETLLMLPLALAYLVYVFISVGAGVHADPIKMTYLVLTGPLTAGALIMFAFAAKRLRLTTIGMFQYIAPSMHFITAVWLFSEPINSMRVISFSLIWISLAIYTFDNLKNRPVEVV